MFFNESQTQNNNTYKGFAALSIGALLLSSVSGCKPIQKDRVLVPTPAWTLKATSTPPSRSLRNQNTDTNRQSLLLEKDALVDEIIEKVALVESGLFQLNGPTIIYVSEGSIVTVAEDTETTPITLSAGINVLAVSTAMSYLIEVGNPTGQFVVFHNLAPIRKHKFMASDVALSTVISLGFKYEDAPWYLIYEQTEDDFEVEKDLFSEDRVGDEINYVEDLANILAEASLKSQN